MYITRCVQKRVILSCIAALATLILGATTAFQVASAEEPASVAQTLSLPGFVLPWDRSLNGSMKFSSGPHAYNKGVDVAKIPAGTGSGLDFGTGGNFDVLAMATGIVEEADPNCTYAGFGCVIAIRHFTGNSVMLYTHLQSGSFEVIPGQRVVRGDVIAVAGDTGGQAAIHLHIELRDGATTCSVESTYCIKHNGVVKWGNPLDWGDLLIPIDGYTFASIYTNGDGIESYNYDGTAVKGSLKVISNFKYTSKGLRINAIARVHQDFTCDPAWSTCELNSEISASSGTYFAGGGRFASLMAASVTNLGGLLNSTNGTTSPPTSTADTTPPSVGDFNVSINGGVASLSVSGVGDNKSGVKEVRYSAKWNDRWYGIGNTGQSPYGFSWNMCNYGVPDGSIEFGMEVWDWAGNVYIWSQHFQNRSATKSYNCGGSGGGQVTPVPQSCTNIGVFDRSWAYFWSEPNCKGEISWFSQHDANGPGSSRQKSAYVPDGKILLISGENDNKGEQGCLSSSVQNLADIGWENKIQWALLTTGSCPTPEPPPSEPVPDVPPIICDTPDYTVLTGPDDQQVFNAASDYTPITFSWNWVGGATRYQVQISNQPDFSYFLFDYHTSRQYVDENLPAGVFYWRVRGENISNSCSTLGSWSNYRQIEIREPSSPQLDCTQLIPPTGVALFTEWNCVGESIILNEGIAGLTYTSWDDIVTSMAVANGHSALVYDSDSDDQTAGMRCVGGLIWDLSVEPYANTPNVIDNSISKIEVFANPDCSGWVPPAPSEEEATCYYKEPTVGIRAFDGRYCAGEYTHFYEGINVLEGDTWDDRITAITLAPNYSAIVYENGSGQEGGMRCVTWWMWDFAVDLYSNKNSYIDNSISRIDVFANPDCSGWVPPEPNEEATCYYKEPAVGIRAFDGRYCAGEYTSLNEGVNILEGGAWDDRITAVTLAPNYSAIVYENSSGREGGMRCVTWWMWDFAVDLYSNKNSYIDNSISRIDVFANPDCSGWVAPEPSEEEATCYYKEPAVGIRAFDGRYCAGEYTQFNEGANVLEGGAWDDRITAVTLAPNYSAIVYENSSGQEGGMRCITWWMWDFAVDLYSNKNSYIDNSISRIDVFANPDCGGWITPPSTLILAPQVLSPLEQHINYGTHFDLQWSRVNGAAFYEIELAADGVSSIWYDSDEIGDFDPFRSYPAAGSYAWRVRAVSVKSEYGEWSEWAYVNLIDPEGSLDIFLPQIFP